MCTAIRYTRGDGYFGRNLDVDFSFHERVVITPRNYEMHLQNGKDYHTRYALIGMAAVMDDCPLYYEAANEQGIGMAGLNFPGNARYHNPVGGRDNIALFEFIPWILGQSATLKEAEALLRRINLTNVMFGGKIPSTPLHFILSDRERSIVAEPLEDGMHITDDPFDVLTNNPPFDYHRWNMQNYLNLNPQNGENHFSETYPLANYGVGMGAMGLPGDASSASRFVRAAFNLTNSISDGTEAGNVTQFFHVLDSVAMVRGATLTDSGKPDFTLYSCCINLTRGIFYYKTYQNNQINAVHLHKADLDAPGLTIFEWQDEQAFLNRN